MYVATLQKESKPSTIKFHNPSKNADRRQTRASYHIENEDSFPIIDNKKKIHLNTISLTLIQTQLPSSSLTTTLPLYHFFLMMTL